MERACDGADRSGCSFNMGGDPISPFFREPHSPGENRGGYHHSSDDAKPDPRYDQS
jgi:hypothetical protein